MDNEGLKILQCRRCGYDLYPLDTVCQKCGARVGTGSGSDSITIRETGRKRPNIIPINAMGAGADIPVDIYKKPVNTKLIVIISISAVLAATIVAAVIFVLMSGMLGDEKAYEPVSDYTVSEVESGYSGGDEDSKNVSEESLDKPEEAENADSAGNADGAGDAGDGDNAGGGDNDSAGDAATPASDSESSNADKPKEKSKETSNEKSNTVTNDTDNSSTQNTTENTADNKDADEARVPSFLEHGLERYFCDLSKEYDYYPIKYKGRNYAAKARFLSYEIIESDSAHPAKEGYEYRIVKAQVLYDDFARRETGEYRSYSSCIEDYYDIESHDKSKEKLDENTLRYKCRMNGNDYTYTVKEEYKYSKWTMQVKFLDVIFTCCVPKGYDGVVVGLYNPETEKGDKPIYEIASDDTLLLRLGNNNTGKPINGRAAYVDIDMMKLYDDYNVNTDNYEYKCAYSTKGFIDYFPDSDLGIVNVGGNEEDWFGNVFGADQYVDLGDNGYLRLENPEIPNGVVVIQCPGAISYETGVILDLNRGYSFHLGYHLMTDNADIYYVNRTAFPIVYESDGGVKLSTNFHDIDYEPELFGD